MEPVARPFHDHPATDSLASPVTRFAPAPTGYLHLGHLVNAVYVWGMARRLGGRVLLRIEDHDRGRSRPAFEAAILNDLDWLGLEPDTPDTDAFRTGPTPFRQSDREERYAQALTRLTRDGWTYRCRCSRKDIAGVAPVSPGEEPRYPGTCRDAAVPASEDAGVRVVMEAGSERFADLRLGPQRQEPAAECGDVLVRDRLGNWTYQFAVTVDDWDQGVDLVIRGEDLLSSTGRQLRLARLLGRTDEPRYLHHPLIRKPSGEKLSKADGATGLAELRAAGATPAALLGEAAYRCGLLSEPKSLAVDDLPGLFGEALTPGP